VCVCARRFTTRWERLTTTSTRLIYFSTPHVALYSLGWRQLWSYVTRHLYVSVYILYYYIVFTAAEHTRTHAPTNTYYERRQTVHNIIAVNIYLPAAAALPVSARDDYYLEYKLYTYCTPVRLNCRVCSKLTDNFFFFYTDDGNDAYTCLIITLYVHSESCQRGGGRSFTRTSDRDKHTHTHTQEIDVIYYNKLNSFFLFSNI